MHTEVWNAMLLVFLFDTSQQIVQEAIQQKTYKSI